MRAPQRGHLVGVHRPHSVITIYAMPQATTEVGQVWFEQCVSICHLPPSFPAEPSFSAGNNNAHHKFQIVTFPTIHSCGTSDSSTSLLIQPHHSRIPLPKSRRCPVKLSKHRALKVCWLSQTCHSTFANAGVAVMVAPADAHETATGSLFH